MSVLSGNRNFEGRINPDVKMNYLASPPLCVAYALAGTMDIDIVDEPLGQDEQGEDVYLRDIWPSEHEIARDDRARRSRRTCSARATARCSRATSAGTRSRCPTGERFAWDAGLDLRAAAAVLRGHARRARAGRATSRARACWRCSATASRPTTSRRRARSSATGPAGGYLHEQGVEPRDFNSYGSRRGNHEVMMRGTFANIRLRNLLGGGEPLPEGGYTRHLGPPDDGAGRPEASRCRSTTRRCATRARACRWSCWRARSTARAPRATGPPRARSCSACAP